MSNGENERVRELERQLEAQRRENEVLAGKLNQIRAKKLAPRTILAYLCLTLGLLMVVPGDVLLWANRTVTNTDQYVNTVGPIIHKPAVQQAIVATATDNMFATINVQQRVSGLLPPQAQPLAGPIAGQVEAYITQTVARIVASDKFAQLWVNVNRTAQQQFMQRAKSGNTSPSVDINQLYQYISGSVSGTALAPLAGKSLPARVGQIQVINVPALANVPHYVSLMSGLTWLVLGMASVFMLLALVVAADRRRMVAAIGLGWMVAIVVGLVAVRILRTVMVGQIGPVYQSAAVEVWQALLTPFYVQSLILFLLGLAMLVGAWLAGPAKVPVSWRRWSQGRLAGWRTVVWPAADALGPIMALRRNHSLVLWLLLAGTGFVLALLAPLTVLSLALVLLAAGILWLILEFLVAPVR